VRTEDPDLLAMLLKAWDIPTGSIAWELAWAAWAEAIAARRAREPERRPPRRPGGRRWRWAGEYRMRCSSRLRKNFSV
jgi:hypothetical protein